MRNFLSVFFATVLILTLGACSVFKEGATKLVSETAQEVEALQLEEYKSPIYEGMNCEIEAAQNAADFESALLSALKLEEKKQAQKSAAAILKPICEVAASSVVPKLIAESGDSRPCLRLMGAEKFKVIGLKGCALIKD